MSIKSWNEVDFQAGCELSKSIMHFKSRKNTNLALFAMEILVGLMHVGSPVFLICFL